LDGRKVGVWAVRGTKGSIPYDHYSVMTEGLSETQIVDVTNEFNSLRLVKSPEELRWLARAEVHRRWYR